MQAQDLHDMKEPKITIKGVENNLPAVGSLSIGSFFRLERGHRVLVILFGEDTTVFCRYIHRHAGSGASDSGLKLVDHKTRVVPLYLVSAHFTDNIV